MSDMGEQEREGSNSKEGWSWLRGQRGWGRELRRQRQCDVGDDIQEGTTLVPKYQDANLIFRIIGSQVGSSSRTVYAQVDGGPMYHLS